MADSGQNGRRKRIGNRRKVWGSVAFAAIISALFLWMGNLIHREFSAVPVYATVTSDSIKQKEQQIADVKKQKDDLKSGLTDLKQIKKELESKKTSLQAYIQELDNTLAQIEANIANLQVRIAEKKEEIELTERELAEALAKEEGQRELMVESLRVMYESGALNFADAIFGAKSFRELLNRADYYESVMGYENLMWEQFKDNSRYVELCREQLQLEKDLLDEAMESVEEEEKNVETLLAQKQNDMAAYQADISTKEKAIREYEASIAQQEEEIKLLEKAIADEKKKLIEQNKKVVKYDGGMFVFPLESYICVTDDYGYRTDPFLGTRSFHNGIDFAANKGTAIYAAYDGVVAGAGYSSSMGNYVMINHGDDLYTIYMHASALYVSKDDVVAAGETIAAVGATGRATGNHLHFTVRKDGVYVSPWDYLK